MTAVADRYRTVAAAFAARVQAVPEERWAAPSPCEGWSARDVVAHVVEAQRIFLRLVGRDLPLHPPVELDPVGAWAVTSAAVQAALEDPTVAQAEYDGLFGRTTFEASVDRVLTGDVVVHTWDLARATGGDEHLDPVEVERVLGAFRGFGAAIRSPGVCGPEVALPPGADRQSQLLAFTGRRP